MGRGFGQLQMGILWALLDNGGMLRVGAILEKLPTSARHTAISRALTKLREKRLIEVYSGARMGGRLVRVVSLTSAGVKEARGIVWEENPSE